MKKYMLLLLGVSLITQPVLAQENTSGFSEVRLKKDLSVLSNDSLQGRKIFTPGIKKAARYIAKNFQSIGLKEWNGQHHYLQKFDLITGKPEVESILWNGNRLSDDHLIAITDKKKIEWTAEQDLKIDTLASMQDIREKVSTFLHPQKNTLVWVKPALEKMFLRLKKYYSHQWLFQSSASTLFVLAKTYPRKFDIKIKNQVKRRETANIVGYLPGKTKPQEYVVFSAHYDHLGVDTTLTGDQIYNGANDDASGTAAVLALARYYKEKGKNNRSLIFVTFTGEEEGGYGSQYFAKQINPDRVVAMFNIEMVGTPAKWGEKSAYITGFEKSDFGEILQKNLAPTSFSFHPDPYPDQHLFYRSDNASLAKVGVPAHTISTAKMEDEPHYHKVSDELSTVDFKNMVQIIQAIAISAHSIVNGEDTPTRVKPQDLE